MCGYYGHLVFWNHEEGSPRTLGMSFGDIHSSKNHRAVQQALWGQGPAMLRLRRHSPASYRSGINRQISASNKEDNDAEQAKGKYNPWIEGERAGNSLFIIPFGIVENQQNHLTAGPTRAQITMGKRKQYGSMN